MSILLQINNLEMSYGSQTILSGATLTVSDKQKIAVVGRNGAGKSTLFRIIVGEEKATSGEVLINSTTKIGYLTQHSNFGDEETVIDFLKRISQKEEWFCAKIASQFQIKKEIFDKKVSSLAGGYQMRVKLSAILATEPNLLLLDEPTNYLDLSTLLLLEQFLKKYKGAFLLISHDREFIKKTCDQTLEIDQGRTTLFPQSLEQYLLYKADKSLTIDKHNKKVLQEKERLQVFVDRFKAKASKAAQAKSKMTQIERLQTLEKVKDTSVSKIQIPAIEDKKGVALKVDDLSIGYPQKVIATSINFTLDRGERIAIVGDNGQGKTTFLKTISGELEKIQGQFNWGSNIKVGYYAQHTPSTLNLTITVKDYLFSSANNSISHEDIFKMAGNFLFDEDALKKDIAVLSGGEKARLCLAAILLQKNHVLLLDEPTNHLDFETVEALAKALSLSKGTVIFVSHNRAFVETLANGIIEIKNGKASRYLHDYENYVYHIKKAIEEDLLSENLTDERKQTSIQNQTPNNTQKTSRETHQLLKKTRNKIEKIESIIKKLETEKKELENWFHENPTEYSTEKSHKIGELQTQIEEEEKQWLDLNEQLDLLSQ